MNEIKILPSLSKNIPFQILNIVLFAYKEDRNLLILIHLT